MGSQAMQFQLVQAVASRYCRLKEISFLRKFWECSSVQVLNIIGLGFRIWADGFKFTV